MSELGNESSDTEAGSDLDASGLMRLEQFATKSVYRSRSRTYARLEAERAKRKQKHTVRSVSSRLVPLPADSDLFQFREPPPVQVKKRQVTSLASEILNESALQPRNPYQMYAKYDGNTSGCAVPKNLCIFVLPVKQRGVRPVKLQLCVDTNAKISDVVGLACFKYSAAKYEPEITRPVSAYALYMAEESGDAEVDLPPFDPTDKLAKYGFTCLAMVPADRISPEKSYVGVTVYADSADPLKVTYDSDQTHSTSLAMVRDRALDHFHPDRSHLLIDYVLEDLAVTGQPLNLDLTLHATTVRSFYLVRKNCARAATVPKGRLSQHGRSVTPVTGVQTAPASLPTDHQLGLLPSSGSKSSGHSKSLSSGNMGTCVFYSVQTLAMFKHMQTDVQFGICADRIEIIPTHSRKISVPSRFRPKGQLPYAVHAMNDVGACEQQTVIKGRATFKLHYKVGREWKSYQFEADAEIAGEIEKKVNKYTARASSTARQEFRQTPPPRKPSVLQRVVGRDPARTIDGNSVSHSSDVR